MQLLGEIMIALACMIISVFVNHQTSKGKVFPDKKSISKTKTLMFNINFSEILPIA